MKIIVSAGGTGGHIYPALAIIDKFLEHDKNTEVLYIGTHNRMEKDIVPKRNIKYIPIEIYGLTKNIGHDIKDIFLISKAKKKLKKIMLEYKPDVVLGIGGYVTYPVITTAKKLNIPIFIHEQNAIPGKVNKLTSKYADIIGVSFKESIKYFKNKKVIYTGNPTGEKALNTKEITRSSLGLSNNKKLVVIVMGSLGSMTINNTMKEFLKVASNEEYQVLYITGKNYYEDYKNNKYNDNIKVLPYLDNLPGLLKNTDILVTRAGASTIAEITALNVVSIFIPSPYVANNHQYYNALELKNSGCGEILEEKDLTSDGLNNKIKELINDKNKYQEIKNNLGKNKTINSSEIIYQNIKELIKNERNM